MWQIIGKKETGTKQAQTEPMEALSLQLHTGKEG